MRRCTTLGGYLLVLLSFVCWMEYFSVLRNKPTLKRIVEYVEINYSETVKKVLLRESMLNITDNWHCANKSACIYSAFWDYRFHPPFVRLIGAVSEKANTSSWKCLLSYEESSSVETPVSLEKIPDGHSKPNTAAFFVCTAKVKPLEVALIVENYTISPIAVRSMKFGGGEKKKQLSVCVRPLFGKLPGYKSALAEFIAYYQVMGASHFTFYDYNAERFSKRLLYEFSKNNISLDLLPWDLPKIVSDTWAAAQHSAIADCIYRNSRDYEYVAVVDIDEYIVPKKDVTLQELLDNLTKPHSKYSTFLFRQSFFCVEAKDDPTSADLSFPLVTQKKTTRDRTIYPKNKRSKYIVRPTAVTTPGIHFIWKDIKSWKTLTVNPRIALLHHYRHSICGSNKKHPGIKDVTVLRYRKRILESVPITVWKRLSGQY